MDNEHAEAGLCREESRTTTEPLELTWVRLRAPGIAGDEAEILGKVVALLRRF